MRSNNQFRDWVFRGTEGLRPFNTEGLTLQQIIEFIRDNKYEPCIDDINDIVKLLNIHEIIELYETLHLHPRIDHHSIRKHSITLEDFKMIRSKMMNISDRAFMTCWDISALSEHIDVSQILEHPEIEWRMTSLLQNRSVTLEHADRLNIPMGHRCELMDRSSIHLCMEIVTGNTCHILARNPELLPEHVLQLCRRFPQEVQRSGIEESFCYELSRNMEPSRIVDTIVLLSRYDIDLSWREVWMNKRLTPEIAERLKILLKDYDRRMYCNCDINDLRDMISLLGDDPSCYPRQLNEVLTTHPRTLDLIREHLVTPAFNSSMLTSAVALHHDIEALMEFNYTCDPEAVLDAILNRDDVVIDHIKRFIARYNVQPRGGYWRPTILVKPEDLIEVIPSIKPYALCRCRWLKISDLSTYAINPIAPEGILDPSELEHLPEIDMRELRYNSKMTHGDYMNLVESGRISFEEIESNWSYIYPNIPFSEAIKFGIDINEDYMSYITIQQVSIDELLTSFTARDIVHGSLGDVLTAPQLLQLGYPGKIRGYTPGMTLGIASRLDINPHECTDLSLQDICNLMSDTHMTLEETGIRPCIFHEIDARLYHLCVIGEYRVIRNCFNPMPFTEKSMRSFLDIEILCQRIDR
uniref:Uncharacterized protein n=1 Tax=viral metagenome TaxID=1070528 RepID=A0A6C0BNC2_9ZZZZ